MLASAVTWSRVLTRWQRGLPAIPAADLPRAPWPRAAVLTGCAWIAFLAVGRVTHEFDGEAALPGLKDVVASLVVSFAVWLALLAALLLGSAAPRAAFGMSLQDWPAQLGYGAGTYVASFLPTVMLMQALSPWRGEDTQHAYLRLLAEAPEWWLVLLMFVAAAIVAPLSEELLFRVVLQGWLTERFGALRGILLAAVIFAIIHGWRDGLALMPLALTLGYLFERRRSYLAVVATHSLFNSVMFGLQWLGAAGGAE